MTVASTRTAAGTDRPLARPPARTRWREHRGDPAAAVVAAGLVAVAAVVAVVLHVAGTPVHASAAPLFGHVLPHVGPGTPLAVTVAALVAWHGPVVAMRLRWSRLLITAYAGAVTWIMALALVDGWQRGLAGRLTTPYEYLAEVGQPVDLGAFAGRILGGAPDSWTTHVAGHPPGALLVFVGLDRLGLGGGGWAATVCVLAGALTAVAVPETVRRVAGSRAARAVLPFAVLFPGAVWIGASADGLFAGVTATGIMLLAIALANPSDDRGRAGRAVAVRVVAGFAGGSLLGLGIYLSYGLVLMALPALAVVLAAWRAGHRGTPALLAAAAGAATVAAAFTAAGFWWPDGYELVQQRYYQGIASSRPYAYWAWANLAALALCAGPAVAAALRRAGRALMPRGGRPWSRPMPDGGVPWPRLLLALAAVAALLAADLSGLSKAETERIWLPFAVWLLAGTALLPARDRRFWLAAQAATALLVNHLVLTGW
ncbi:hypothetical protein [Mangrovihabitans endophyticus]|uniref:Integral membrane protein n=1 Tax=Mangrovihabitans endophyticus TaxID=1751298 RepID=A0A8J3BY15_9ACTN|nr:hypothetical protein [Mangrovihabitans endophyticus]GGK80632.1 hypothetical protein GCM10012284_13200 [Mangrovihabitans endophyticus]